MKHSIKEVFVNWVPHKVKSKQVSFLGSIWFHSSSAYCTSRVQPSLTLDYFAWPILSVVLPVSGVKLSAGEIRLLEISFQEHGRIALPAWTWWQEQLVRSRLLLSCILCSHFCWEWIRVTWLQLFGFKHIFQFPGAEDYYRSRGQWATELCCVWKLTSRI